MSDKNQKCELTCKYSLTVSFQHFEGPPTLGRSVNADKVNFEKKNKGQVEEDL